MNLRLIFSRSFLKKAKQIAEFLIVGPILKIVNNVTTEVTWTFIAVNGLVISTTIKNDRHLRNFHWLLS